MFIKLTILSCLPSVRNPDYQDNIPDELDNRCQNLVKTCVPDSGGQVPVPLHLIIIFLFLFFPTFVDCFKFKPLIGT